jgi:AcrR family transcriptional regulator
MNTCLEQTTGRSGRPRDSAAHEAILKASKEILVEKGIGGFAIEAVAARAGVAKSTIYRWWPSKGALAIAGFLADTAPKIPYDHSGSALVDIRAQLRRVCAVYSGSTGRVLSAIIADGQRDPNTIQAFVDGYARPRREEAKAILQDGVMRGELRAGIDFDVVLDALYGPIYYRMLVPLAPLNNDWIDALVTCVMEGIKA